MTSAALLLVTDDCKSLISQGFVLTAPSLPLYPHLLAPLCCGL